MVNVKNAQQIVLLVYKIIFQIINQLINILFKVNTIQYKQNFVFLNMMPKLKKFTFI